MNKVVSNVREKIKKKRKDGKIDVRFVLAHKMGNSTSVQKKTFISASGNHLPLGRHSQSALG